MRSRMVGLCFVAPVLAGVSMMVLCDQAQAQDKIAPSRSYGANYVTTLKQRPEKEFGLPAFGRKSSGMLEQKALNADTPPPERPGQPKTETNAMGDDGRTSAAALPAPQARPGADAVPSSAQQPDFFASSTDFGLRKPGRGDTYDTPLFTTQDEAGPADDAKQGD